MRVPLDRTPHEARYPTTRDGEPTAVGAELGPRPHDTPTTDAIAISDSFLRMNGMRDDARGSTLASTLPRRASCGNVSSSARGASSPRKGQCPPSTTTIREGTSLLSA